MLQLLSNLRGRVNPKCVVFLHFSCFFDGIKGRVANICFTTIPSALILIVNATLYSMTFKRLRSRSKAVSKSLNGVSTSLVASQRAAQSMSLFVIAFFIQWWAMVVYGIWGLLDENIPQPLFHLMTIFSNIGGCLNLGVYLLIRRKRALKTNKVSTIQDSRR